MTRLIGKAYLGAVRWAILLATVNLAAFCFLFFHPNPSLRGQVSDWASCFIPILAGACCFGFRKTSGFHRLSGAKHLPAVLGGAAICYGVGQLAYIFETRFLQRSGNPGYGDIFFLLQYGFFILAICLWPSRPMPAAMRWRTWSDAIVLLFGLMAFGWLYLIGPAVRESDMTALGIVIDTAYPVTDIFIIFSVLQMMRKGFDPRFRFATHLFVLALGINTVGDIYHALGRYDGAFVSGNWLDMTWPLSASMAALAGLIIRIRMQVPGYKDAETCEKIIVSQRTWTLYAPYVLVPAVGILIVQVSASGTPAIIRNGLYLIGLGLVIAILLRQLIVIAENGSLYSKLRDAYDELETKNMEVSLAADETERINEKLKSMARELSGQNQSLAATNEELEQLATRDGMTSLANHRAFQETLKQEIAKANRHKHGLVLALIDVDFFKLYNDHYGHPAGDEVLKSIARLLQESTRSGDLAARYGGEEFALLLPYADKDEALKILERLREAVSSFPFKHRRVTLSIGMSLHSEDVNLPEQMVDFADKALYAAKSRGRNQVVLAGDALASIEANHQSGKFELSTPMGFGAVLSAGLQYNPQALSHEPHCALIAGLLATLELKDPMTRGHSQRVMWFALRLAEEGIRQGSFEMSAGMIRSLGFGALLHDIGRIGIRESVLNSIEPFNQEERAEIERHPEIGGDLVRRFPGLIPAVEPIVHHHERWDGKGYPNRLGTVDIPLTARILAFADAFNAMSTDRPYAAKRTYEEIISEFESESGQQFDPMLLPIFKAIPVAEWERLRMSEPMDITAPSIAA